MNKKHFLTFALAILAISLTANAQDSTLQKKNSKSGFSFGAVPVIAFDSDIGFKYGALVNLYDYGDGSIYPGYKHSLYLEWSRTTKGSGINQITYDSKYLIPGIRVSGEVSYLTEKNLDFYGYNGYKVYYNSHYENDQDTAYISRMFYRQDRKLLRLRADFQGKLKVDKLSWVAGIVYYDVKLDTVDINKLNEGKSAEDKLPYVNGGLFGNYADWNVLPGNELDGGSSTLLKGGLVYDSRDNEPNPMKGIWTDLMLLVDPGLFGGNNAYGKYVFTHRQYFTLLPDKLSFVYRLSYQGKLFGTTPSYMLPFAFSSGRYTDRDGLGGAKTMRGILRDRVVGEDVAFANFEIRWKFIRTVVAKQNIYLALSGFTDMGLVTREYKVDTKNVPDTERKIFFPDDNEGIHQSLGAGFRVGLNENFIVAVDYGRALDERDGDSGLYINLNWLF
jgi:hypothetical protein